jgi:hypothetical protein
MFLKFSTVTFIYSDIVLTADSPNVNFLKGQKTLTSVIKMIFGGKNTNLSSFSLNFNNILHLKVQGQIFVRLSDMSFN